MSRRTVLVPTLAAGLGLAAVGGRIALGYSAQAIRSRVDPELDPLYDLPDDVVSHDVPAADGGSLRVLERGAGRPLLLIHGITLQARVWAPQFHLMADRYRILAMDVRGHGASTAGREGFGRAIAARDIESVLEHFDLRHAVIVGHSMGGMILMEFAGQFVDALAHRVAGLVFMDTAAYQIAPKPVLPLAKALGRRVRSRHEAGRPVPQRQMGDDDLSWVLTRLAFGSHPPARAVDEVRRCGAEVPQSTSLPSGIDLLDHDARRALAATSTPSLVMVGSRDLLTPVYAARRIARFLPDARFEVLAGAGHQLMQERPHEVARLLDRFTASLPAPGGEGPAA
ncbi:MAG: alpha/beta hydrolase [Actinomycetota bacterium]|nr:alpha/beta hydrolase [Actinomycetota bacterium]